LMQSSISIHACIATRGGLVLHPKLSSPNAKIGIIRELGLEAYFIT
jgi:hypothetical protein